jgi:tetratricopeptide (TPR) repeat protein/CHAT domain-containing protein
MSFFLCLFCLLITEPRLHGDEPPAPPLPKPNPERLKERDRYVAERQKLWDEDRLGEAIVAGEKALAIERQMFGDTHDDVAGSLDGLAGMHEDRDEFAAARTARREILEIEWQLHGADSWQADDARRDLEITRRLEALPHDARRLYTRSKRLVTRVIKLSNEGHAREALRPAEEAVRLRKEIFGDEHWLTAQPLAWLADVYKRLGDSDRSHDARRRVLEIRRHAFGENHPQFVQALENLGASYLARREYAKSEPLLREALERRKQLVGQDNPAYARNLHNLAYLYLNMKKYSRAESYFLDALRIKRQILGDQTTEYAVTLGGLANLYSERQEFPRAQAALRQAIEIQKQTLGEKHPDVALSLDNLALACREAGDAALAEGYYRQSLAITRTVYGERHAAYAQVLEYLGELFQRTNQPEKAEPLLRQAADIFKSGGQATLRQYAFCLNQLGVLCGDSGDAKKAKAAYEQSLDADRQLHAEREPIALLTAMNLGLAYSNTQDYDRALPLMRRVVDVHRELGGPRSAAYRHDIRILLKTLVDAADAAERRDNFPEARKALREVVDLRTGLLGKDHWETRDAILDLDQSDRISKLGVDIRARLAHASQLMNQIGKLDRQGKTRAAIPLAEEAVGIRQAELGADDRLTGESLDWLGYLYNQLADYKHAEPLLQRALVINERALGKKHPMYLSTLRKLASLTFKHKAYEQAAVMYREAHGLQADMYGLRDSRTRQTANDLANTEYQLGQRQFQQLDFVGARKSFQAWRDTQTASLGPEHWKVTNARTSLAYVDQFERLNAGERRQLSLAEDLERRVNDLIQRDHYHEALAPAQQSLEIRQRILGPKQALTLSSLDELGTVYFGLGELAKAEPLRVQLVELGKEVRGKKHPDYATYMHHLAGVYASMGAFDKADLLYREALAIRKEVLGEDSSAYAASLNDLAVNCGKRGDRAQQEFLLHQALAVHRKVEGPQSPAYAISLGNLAVVYAVRGNPARAEALLKEAAEIVRRTAGVKSTRYASILHTMASAADHKGDTKTAETLYKQAADIEAAVLGKQHETYLETLSDLGTLYIDSSQFEKARSLLNECEQVTKATFGEKHPNYARCLRNLGALNLRLGQFPQAEAALQQSVAIYKQALGERHPEYANSLKQLARLYLVMQSPAKAEPIYLKVLDITKSAVGEKDPAYGSLLTEVGDAYLNMDDYDRALSFHRRAVEIARAVYGEKHVEFAAAIAEMALVYQNLKEYAQAEPLYRRSLAIQKELDSGYPLTARAVIFNLASLYFSKGDLKDAEPLMRQAVELNKQSSGDRHPKYANGLYHLAMLQLQKGDFAESERLLRASLAIYRQSLGERSGEYAKCLREVGRIAALRGDFPKAEALVGQALEIKQQDLEQTASAQSEKQQLGMLLGARVLIDLYVSVAIRAHVAPDSIHARVVGWKGVVSGRQTEMRRLRLVLQSVKDSEFAKTYRQLDEATAKLAALSTRAPDVEDPTGLSHELAETNDEIERLEKSLAARSAECRKQQQRQKITVGELRTALPPGTALVDLFEYADFDPRPTPASKLGAWHTRVLAFVVRPDRATAMIDLGPDGPLTDAVTAWRKDFGRPQAGEPDSGQALRRLAWQPLQDSCAGITLLLVSPDGALARFPWAAIPGKQAGTYLIEELAVVTVPIPSRLSELLAAPRHENANQSLLVVGDVRFDGLASVTESGNSPQASLRATRSGSLFHWSELPGTSAEAEAIRKTFASRFPNARMTDLRRDDATEGAVRRDAPRYQYLHFATHGYFAPPELRSALASASKSDAADVGNLFAKKDVAGFHPGLLSGLVLAGANRPVDFDHDDGILTALEVEALDLGGVELATLSACETGLGQTAGSEGLLGLQRAFQTAGAHSVVAGLWKVPDRATQALMQRFYENLWQKRLSKIDALREAQLWMLHEGPKQPDILRGLDAAPEIAETGKSLPPYYWAAFVLSGDWR